MDIPLEVGRKMAAISCRHNGPTNCIGRREEGTPKTSKNHPEERGVNEGGREEVGQGAPRRRRRRHSGRPQWGASYRRSFADAPLRVSPLGHGMEGGWRLAQMWALGVDANLH